MSNTEDGEARFRATMQSWEQAAWCLAAAVLAAESPEPLLRDAASAVLSGAGFPASDVSGSGGVTWSPVLITAQLKATLLQAAALVGDKQFSWLDQSDEALRAQGLASAQAGPLFVRFVLPQLDGLAARLSRPDAHMLDVGTGVGALAVAYAEQLPQLTVTGIDVSSRVLALGRDYVAGTPVADRVHLRERDVTAIEEEAAYDLAWLPAPLCRPSRCAPGYPRWCERCAPADGCCSDMASSTKPRSMMPS